MRTTCELAEICENQLGRHLQFQDKNGLMLLHATCAMHMILANWSLAFYPKTQTDRLGEGRCILIDSLQPNDLSSSVKQLLIADVRSPIELHADF